MDTKDKLKKEEQETIPPGGIVVKPEEKPEEKPEGGQTGYQSKWQEQLNSIFEQIQNRPDFTYDVNADALYQQYKDQYTRNGRLAMEDTLGKAAAMTGGYGNSYAQNVGQQAYQGYMQDLNDVIPELYQLALDKYNRDGALLKEQYGMLLDRDSLDYGRWADDRDFGYQQGRDEIADKQWQAQFDEDVRRFNFANQLGEFAPAPGGSSGGGSSGGSSSGGSKGSGGSKKPKPFDPEGGQSLTDAAADVAKEYGVGEAMDWVNSVNTSTNEKLAAKENAAGVEKTEYYKNQVIQSKPQKPKPPKKPTPPKKPGSSGLKQNAMK